MGVVVLTIVPFSQVSTVQPRLNRLSRAGDSWAPHEVVVDELELGAARGLLAVPTEDDAPS